MATIARLCSSVCIKHSQSLSSRFPQLVSQNFVPPARLFTQLPRTPTKIFSRHFTRKSKTSLTPVESVEASPKAGFRVLLRPLVFTVAVSGCSFAGAIIWQYENLRQHFKDLRDHNRQDYNQHKFYGKAGSFRHHLNLWWNKLTPGAQLVAGIIASNVAVFGLWKIRPLQNFMMKYFCSSPFSGAPCTSMVLSAFSHYSLFHLGANMFVLWSFAGPITQLLGREQFTGFYFTAGVVSGFTSYIYKVVHASPVPSLGASGIILAILGAVCCQYPDARLSIAFVDMIVPHSFSADSAMKALVIFDSAGILLGWRLFDHAAHLGGLLFGIWYQKYGKDIVWRQYREPVMKIWHNLRGKP